MYPIASKALAAPLWPGDLAVAAFFIHALATTVPAGDLRILEAPWLAAALTLASLSTIVLSVYFAQQCRRLNARAEMLYLLAPVCMFAYYVYRILSG